MANNLQRNASKRNTLKYMPKGVSSVDLLREGKLEFHQELNAVRSETARINEFFSGCKPDDVIELVQTANKVQSKLDKVFQRTNKPQHAAILSEHSVIVEVMEKLKSITKQYVALLASEGQNLPKYLASRSRRKVEQFSSSLLVEVSVLVELSDDLLSYNDSNYQVLPDSADPEERVEISDPEGARMWMELFGQTFMVDAAKVVKGLMKDLNVNLSSAERKILLQVFDPSNTGQFTSLRWNEFLKGFGPFRNCLFNLQEMLAKPWFHGFLSKSDSTKLLEVEPQGTFMVRFSSTKPGSFSLAHTMPNSVVNHVIIHTRDNGFAVREEAREKLFPSVSHLIEAYAQLLVRPYQQTFFKQLWWHGDISGDEASELLKDKKQGTFIIRFSSTQRGCFASSFVGKDNVIEKGLIIGSPTGYTLSGKQFESMEAIVASLQQWQIFTVPYKNTTNEVNDSMRFKIVSEIVSTEQSYVRTLDMICNLFVREFRANAKIRPEDVNGIFANVEQILAIHRQFVGIIEQTIQNWDADNAIIGPHFINLNAQLVTPYSVYINNYNNAMAVVERLSQKKEFKEWMAGVMAQQRMQNMLSGFLIQVIQRIPRYILLLTDLIKHTSGPHTDYDGLVDALEALKNSADQINENKKVVEDVEEVRKTCSLISGLAQDLAVVGRYVVKEGKLNPTEFKKGEYYIFFFNDLLLMTTRDGKKYKLKEMMNLDNVQIIPVPDTAVSCNQFRVVTTRTEITFEADTPAEKSAWVATLKKEYSARSK